MAARSTRRILGGGALMILSLAARGLPAQRVNTAMNPETVVGVNVALGAGTAAVKALVGKRPVLTALLKGAVGGGVMAGGMMTAGGNGPNNRFLSVQAMALGASMARNAGDGRGVFSRMTFTLSPLVIDVDAIRRTENEGTSGDRHSRRGVAMKLRLSAVGVTGIVYRLANNDGMKLDWKETLGAGYVVFRTNSPSYAMYGACPAGRSCERAGDFFFATVAYAEYRDPQAVRATLAHENLHMTQHTRDAVLFGIPTSEATLNRMGPVGRFLNKVVVLDYVLPLSLYSLYTGEAAGTHHRSWYELEARSFSPGSAPTFDDPPR
jgi:hypothetical protein